MSSDFRSPLAIQDFTEFVAIDFGAVTPDAQVVALAERLEASVRRAVADLPPAMSAEAAAELTVYAGPRPRFIDLFYIPIWSFVHWVPEAAQRAELVRVPSMIEHAQEAHALSLFMHLWDDHLVDGQLKPTLLRLQLRAIAWQRYHAAVGVLAGMVEGGPETVARLVGNYLTACHQPPPVHDLRTFCDRFLQQIGIWLVVPTLLGHIVGGPAAARDLVGIIEAFAVAWRLIDDIQDIDIDILSGQDNGVWFELDDDGRACWAACRTASAGADRVEPRTWASVSTAIRNTRTLGAVIDEVTARLSRAEELAIRAGWTGLAAELAASRRLRGLGS